MPHHWRTLTFPAALRVDRIEAPCVIDGPINGEAFRAYVEQSLVPTLRPATSSSWTTSVRTKARLSARRSGLPAPGASSCRLFARSQSDRAGLCQAQASPAQGPGAHYRSHMAVHRKPHRPLLVNRVRELFPQRRLRFSVRLTGSSGSRSAPIRGRTGSNARPARANLADRFRPRTNASPGSSGSAVSRSLMNHVANGRRCGRHSPSPCSSLTAQANLQRLSSIRHAQVVGGGNSDSRSPPREVGMAQLRRYELSDAEWASIDPLLPRASPVA